MKSRRNVVAVLALLALLNASPSSAGWDNPGGDCLPSEISCDDMLLMADVGLQVLQAAF